MFDLSCEKVLHCLQGNRTEELPNLGKREAATVRRFIAFVIKHKGKFLVRQRPAGVVNAHLWEFPNIETNGDKLKRGTFSNCFRRETGGFEAAFARSNIHNALSHHAGAFEASLKKPPDKIDGVWKSSAQLQALAFSSAHKKLASAAARSILSGR